MSNKSSLNLFSEKKFSQFGEDGIISEILNRINSKNLDKWCVEFGASDGILYSNTHNLIKNHNYQAVLIEADKKQFNKLNKNIDTKKVIKLNKFVKFDGENSLEQILKKTEIPKNFDLISIDIDGCDYYIMEDLKYYKPKIICIEFNHTIPNEVEFVQEKNFKIKHGSSALSLINLAISKGYLLAASTLTNLIFIDNKYKSEVLADKVLTIEDLRSDKEYKNIIFSGYDGSVISTRPIDLSWHKIKINNKKFQILPFFLRKFPADYNFFEKILFFIYREFLFPGRFIKKFFNKKIK